MEDSEIIQLYEARNEDAIRETENKYQKFLFGLAFNIVENISDAQECVNDTLLAAWNNIPPQKPLRFSAFLAKITRYSAMDLCDKRYAQKRDARMQCALSELDESVIQMFHTPEQELEGIELSQTISKFLHHQTDFNKALFVQRYFYFATNAEIAKEMQVSEDKVAKRLYRIRNKLRVVLEQEGYQ